MAEIERKTTWNLADNDIERLNFNLKTSSAILYSLRDVTFLQENPTRLLLGVDALKEVYRIIRPIMTYSDQSRYDGKISELRDLAEKETRRNVKFNEQGQEEKIHCSNKLYYSIDQFYDELMQKKQEIGLGIPTEQKLSHEVLMHRQTNPQYGKE